MTLNTDPGDFVTRFGLYPWQTKILEMCRKHDRSIVLIYDPHGNSGKSTFSDYLDYKQVALKIRSRNFMKSLATHEAYTINMPDMNKDQLFKFISDVESLKDGHIYEMNRRFKKRRIDRPQVVVFTNWLPSCFSTMGKWKVYVMTSEKDIEL